MTDAEHSVACLEHIKEGFCLCRSIEIPAIGVIINSETSAHISLLKKKTQLHTKESR